jgi:hypothetical protein
MVKFTIPKMCVASASCLSTARNEPPPAVATIEVMPTAGGGGPRGASGGGKVSNVVPILRSAQPEMGCV